MSAANVDSARARSASSSSIDRHHSIDANIENENDIMKERSKTIESTYHSPRNRSDRISSTMINRKLPQIPKDNRSISVAVPSHMRNTISHPSEIDPAYRNRNRNEDSVDGGSKGMDLHNRELPHIPFPAESARRSSSGSNTLLTSRSTSELRSFQEVKPKSFSNRELPEIPRDAEVNAAKILKSVQGQHSHAGSSSPMLESTTDGGQVFDPSRQGPLPPVPSRSNDRRNSRDLQFAERPYVRLDSFSDSNSDSEYQSSHDQIHINKESNQFQSQVDSAEESKDFKLSVGMLAPWKWAKMRRMKAKSNSDSKTEDEDSDSRSDSTLNKELSSSTGNLEAKIDQNHYPLRKSTSMPIQDDKNNESQFATLSKEYSFKTADRSTIASLQQNDKSKNAGDDQQSKNTTGTTSEVVTKRGDRRVSHDDDYLEPSEVAKIVASNRNTLDPERPNKSRLKRRTARRSKALGPQSAIYSKYRSGQLVDSDEPKEDAKDIPPSQPVQSPRGPNENRRNSANRNFVVLSFIDGGTSIKQDSSFFSNLHKPVRLVSPMPTNQGKYTSFLFLRTAIKTVSNLWHNLY